MNRTNNTCPTKLLDLACSGVQQVNDVIVILLFLSLKLTFSGAQVKGKEVQLLYLVLGHEEARILLETCRCEVCITAYWIFVRCCGCECLSPNSILYQVRRIII